MNKEVLEYKVLVYSVLLSIVVLTELFGTQRIVVMGTGNRTNRFLERLP
jgi:hypothetical protein